MPNEQDRPEPLTASVSEQLRGKAEAELQADAQRQAEERRREGLERHMADERERALRHGGGEHGVRPRSAYPETPPSTWWIAGAATMLVGFLCGVRGKRLLTGTATILLLARVVRVARDRAERARLLAGSAATAG
jgi:hypothetical protein